MRGARKMPIAAAVRREPSGCNLLPGWSTESRGIVEHSREREVLLKCLLPRATFEKRCVCVVCGALIFQAWGREFRGRSWASWTSWNENQFNLRRPGAFLANEFFCVDENGPD